ncbi:MAG: hypothetical protein WCP29_00230 [Acidobacteriota bacterium]
MIMWSYQLLCGLLAALALWGLARPGARQEKALLALILVPLVLRALLVK